MRNPINKQHINHEQWLLDQLTAAILKQPDAARTIFCPPAPFLHDYAKHPDSFSLSDTRIEHVSTCSFCLAQLLRLRGKATARRRFTEQLSAFSAVLAACLLLGFVTASLWNRSRHSFTPNKTVELHQPMKMEERTIDLTDYGTYRGGTDQIPKPALVLPSTLVHLNLVLPRFSESGSYTVLVARNRHTRSLLASGRSVSKTQKGHNTVEVVLDLRGAQSGDYFLLTQLDGQDDPYSYPLKLQ